MRWYDPRPSNPEKSIKSVSETDDTNDSMNCAPKSWLEILPSRSGTALAAILAEIMTEGLTPNQENILGNFISAVGSLISYKSSRDDVN